MSETPDEASLRVFRERLVRLGWSTRQLALLVGCNPRTARRWVDGTRLLPTHVAAFVDLAHDTLVKAR